MSETLSVINEHITDMNSPRSSFANSKRDTIGSVYSTQPLNRFSYIPGHETDEDEHHYHSEDEVMAWSPDRVAEYLEDNGVEKMHCNVFREQEISGEVLLAMDQSSIFIKEFDLGPVGRRLKTWHKIKVLQDEVRQNAPPGVVRSTFEYPAGVGAADDRDSGAVRNRSSTIGTILPRALSTASTRRSMDAGALQYDTAPPYSQPGSPTMTHGPGATSPLQSMTSMSRAENTYRPSAQIIRTMNHARRHSSIDSTSSAGTRLGHRKQPSIDQNWQPGQPAQVNGDSVAYGHTMSTQSTANLSPNPDSSLIQPSSPGELDRGYFSSNEADNRSTRSKLTKKDPGAAISPVPSRPNSVLTNGRQSAQSGGIASSKSGRDQVSSVGSIVAPQHLTSAITAVTSKFGSLRSVTSSTPQSKPITTMHDSANPVVTKLEYGTSASLNAAMASTSNIQAGSEPSSVDATPSPSSGKLGVLGNQKQKAMTLRTVSDAVTGKEKQMAPIVVDGVAPSTKEDLSSPPRTDSTTPSTEARSFDLQKSVDGQSRTSTGSGSKLMPPATSNRRARPKTKKATSAYTRGLVKKTPAEQIAGCDYSGWMKKKSGSLMTTWKSRLFILKGRRLSYYYRDDDREEKGLIDISFHRVLPAQNETLTGFHAAVTGAAATPTSPTNSSTPTSAEKDLKANPPQGEADDGLFIFKLVPPKSGLAKGVSFTKPTVHYFAVNSLQEGRLWMAALMKATIDRDEDGVVTTTYNQQTISLAKARARKERPPALKEEEAEGRVELEGDAASVGDVENTGLGIVNFDEKNEKVDSDLGIAELKDEPGALPTAENGSVAPAPAATDTEAEVLNEKVIAPSRTSLLR